MRDWAFVSLRFWKTLYMRLKCKLSLKLVVHIFYFAEIYCRNLIYSGELRETLNPSEPNIRIIPSSALLRLRVGQVVNITMEYYDTENKPLDLYYVMDLSATMADDKVFFPY